MTDKLPLYRDVFVYDLVAQGAVCQRNVDQEKYSKDIEARDAEIAELKAMIKMGEHFLSCRNKEYKTLSKSWDAIKAKLDTAEARTEITKEEWIDAPDKRGCYWQSSFIDDSPNFEGYVTPRTIEILEFSDGRLEVDGYSGMSVADYVEGYPQAKYMFIPEPKLPIAEGIAEQEDQMKVTLSTTVGELIPEGDDCYGKADEPTCKFLFNGYYCNLKDGYCKDFAMGAQKREDCPKPPVKGE